MESPRSPSVVAIWRSLALVGIGTGIGTGEDN